MKKILFISNIVKGVTNFSKTSLIAAQKLGYEFHIAANINFANKENIESDEKKYGVKIHHIPFKRNPFNLKNIRAYLKLIKLIKSENYDIVHCNTPVGGVLGRLASKKCKVKTVIYMVHGFHFFKGAPFKNWLIYYPAERLLTRSTDALITITKDDYNFAKNKMYFKKVYYIPGVGINVNDIKNYSAQKNIREELKLPENAVTIVSVGEINKNKNHKVVINALNKLKNSNIYYIICGVGQMQSYLEKLALKYNISENVRFLGFRNDIKDILKNADIFIMPSFREGLSRALMEAMAAGLPCIASKIRGNVELIEEGKGGYLVKPDDVDGFKDRIKQLTENKDLRGILGEFNLNKVNEYDADNVVEEIYKIYKDIEESLIKV